MDRMDAQPRPAPLTDPVPFLMAHRGFDLSGLENSMRAFEAAVALGVTFLETDVQATADGIALAFHDATLDRVTDGHGKVAELTWRQLQEVRIGGSEPIPRLEEVFDAWPQVRVNVDVKAPGAVAPFVRAVRRARARDRVVVASFSDRRREAAVRALAHDGPVAWSPGIGGTARVVLAAARGEVDRVTRALAGAACLQVPERFSGVPVVTVRLVRQVHAAGAQVHVWTIDEPAAMHRLLDLGIDAIVTNRVDLALKVLADRGDSHGR
jgi:glycerophosphoryl diester phosphodiesterase